jgi:hypothetical protein
MFIWFIEGHVYTVLRDLTGKSIIAVVSVVTLSKSVKKKRLKQCLVICLFYFANIEKQRKISKTEG